MAPEAPFGLTGILSMVSWMRASTTSMTLLSIGVASLPNSGQTVSRSYTLKARQVEVKIHREILFSVFYVHLGTAVQIVT